MSEVKEVHHIKKQREEKVFNPNPYEFFEKPITREQLVRISSNIANYLHSNGIRRMMLIDRSARPAYLGIREAWKRKFPGESLPQFYFVNPTGFVDDFTILEPGRVITYVPRGIEIMLDGTLKGNDTGSFTAARSERDIRNQFRETYRRLYSEKDESLLLFDTCIHSGNSVRSVIETLRNIGFTNLKTGVVNAVDNTSEIKPDFVAWNGEPFFPCHPFHQDMIIDRKFGSVTSTPTYDSIRRNNAIKLRKEILRIFQEAPVNWLR